MRKDRLTTAANHKATPPGARPRCRWAGASRQPWEQPVPNPSRPDLRPLDGAEAQMSSPTPHRTRGPRLPPCPPLPVVNRGLAGGSCTDMGKVADAGDDCARDRGRWPPKDTGMPAASMDAWKFLSWWMRCCSRRSACWGDRRRCFRGPRTPTPRTRLAPPTCPPGCRTQRGSTRGRWPQMATRGPRSPSPQAARLGESAVASVSTESPWSACQTHGRKARHTVSMRVLRSPCPGPSRPGCSLGTGRAGDSEVTGAIQIPDAQGSACEAVGTRMQPPGPRCGHLPTKPTTVGRKELSTHFHDKASFLQTTLLCDELASLGVDGTGPRRDARPEGPEACDARAGPALRCRHRGGATSAWLHPREAETALEGAQEARGHRVPTGPPSSLPSGQPPPQAAGAPQTPRGSWPAPRPPRANQLLSLARGAYETRNRLMFRSANCYMPLRPPDEEFGLLFPEYRKQAFLITVPAWSARLFFLSKC